MNISIKSLIAILAVLVLTHSAYNQKISKELAYMSAISYESVKAIDAWSC